MLPGSGPPSHLPPTFVLALAAGVRVPAQVLWSSGMASLSLPHVSPPSSDPVSAPLPASCPPASCWIALQGRQNFSWTCPSPPRRGGRKASRGGEEVGLQVGEVCNRPALDTLPMTIFSAHLPPSEPPGHSLASFLYLSGSQVLVPLESGGIWSFIERSYFFSLDPR